MKYILSWLGFCVHLHHLFAFNLETRSLAYCRVKDSGEGRERERERTLLRSMGVGGRREEEVEAEHRRDK